MLQGLLISWDNAVSSNHPRANWAGIFKDAAYLRQLWETCSPWHHFSGQEMLDFSHVNRGITLDVFLCVVSQWYLKGPQHGKILPCFFFSLWIWGNVTVRGGRFSSEAVPQPCLTIHPSTLEWGTWVVLEQTLWICKSKSEASEFDVYQCGLIIGIVGKMNTVEKEWWNCNKAHGGWEVTLLFKQVSFENIKQMQDLNRKISLCSSNHFIQLESHHKLCLPLLFAST